MAIHFPSKPGVYTPNTTVAFQSRINDVEVTCEVSAEALLDHCGAVSDKSADLLTAFDRNRALIESVAGKVLPQRAPIGRCLLVSADF